MVAGLPHGLTVEVDQTGNPFVDELLVEPIRVVDGRMQLSERPGLGVELDFKHLKQVAEITEPVTARAQTYFRPDGSITNW